MEEEFTLYPEALALKELGFDKACLATYRQWDGIEPYLHLDGEIEADNFTIECDAPTYSQAFRWFRDKGLYITIIPSYIDKTHLPIIYNFQKEGFQSHIELGICITHEEAELACLKKLIELVKEKKV